MDANTHELVMMAITAIVFLSIGYVAGRIIQRFMDVKEFEQEDELSYQQSGGAEVIEQQAA